MVERLDIYRCNICGTIVQVFNRGDGELVCCGHPMEYLKKHTPQEELQEKHVPVKVDDKIQVGSIPHPMLPEHHIKFIETVSADKKRLQVEFLDLTDNPEMEILPKNADFTALEYCNLHGLWRN